MSTAEVAPPASEGAPMPEAAAPAEAPPAPAPAPAPEPAAAPEPATTPAPSIAPETPPAEPQAPPSAAPDKPPTPKEESAASAASNVAFSKSAGDGFGGASKASVKKSDALLRRDSKQKEASTRWSSSSKHGRSKLAIGSMLSIKRGSYTDYAERAKVIRYANSYKMESDNPFNIEKVGIIIKEILIETIEDMRYDPEDCPIKAKIASGMIRDKIKEENYDRYKIVCIVTIGEKKSQDMISVIRFLWDIERDYYAHYFHENMHVFIAAVVFGVYYE